MINIINLQILEILKHANKPICILEPKLNLPIFHLNPQST